jgi:glycosyltransferase involved in cell wall biosynthesis
MADYSIIIPAYNEEAYLPQALASVYAAAADVSEAVEVVVVDNNSNDRTAEIARSMGATVVHEPINQIARARNTGARVAKGRFFVFLDADTTLTSSLLGEALRNLASGNIAGGGSTVAPDRPLDASARNVLNIWNRFSRRFNIAAGCFVYCEKEAFRAVGGFSERLYASEEIWFSIRMHRWAHRQGKRFLIIRNWPVVTSVRKLDWFSPARLLLSSLVLTLFPFALFSRRLCHIWYYRPKSSGGPAPALYIEIIKKALKGGGD